MALKRINKVRSVSSSSIGLLYVALPVASRLCYRPTPNDNPLLTVFLSIPAHRRTPDDNL